MKPSPIEIALARIVDALEAEIIATTDEDIAAAVADLGIKPHMKGSIALFDLIHDHAGARFGDVANYPSASSTQGDNSRPASSPSADDDMSSDSKGRSHRDP